MNITLAVDDKAVIAARATAQAMDKSLNLVVREHPEPLAGVERIKQEVKELHLTSETGNYRGWKFDRYEVYAERTAQSETAQNRSTT